MPDISDLFEPLEHTIRTVFIKTLIKRDANDVEREMLGLPARLGGLGITSPVISTPLSHTNSIAISAPLVKLIKDQETTLDPSTLLDKVRLLRLDVDIKNDERSAAKKERILSAATPALRAAVQAASEKGASSWITALPSLRFSIRRTS